MSATTTARPSQEIDLGRCHRAFPDCEILECAEKLKVIADAHRVGIGGQEGSVRLLVEAINTAEILKRSLVRKGEEWGVLDPGD